LLPERRNIKLQIQFENKQAAEEILQSEKGELGGDWRKLHTEELCVFTFTL
jgi:hypothetical protein